MGAVGKYRALTLYEAVAKSGALGGLEFLCDCRDRNSWDGSGMLRDLSGKGNHFYNGDTAGVDTDDMVLLGPIGSRLRLTNLTNTAGNNGQSTSSLGNTAFILGMSRPGAKWSWLQITTFETVRMGDGQFVNSNAVEMSSKLVVADTRYMAANLKITHATDGTPVDEKLSTLKAFPNPNTLLGNNDGQCFNVVTLDAANSVMEVYANDLYEKITFSMATADSAAPAQTLRAGGGGTPNGGAANFQSLQVFAAWSRILSPNEVFGIYRKLLPNYQFTNQRAV